MVNPPPARVGKRDRFAFRISEPVPLSPPAFTPYNNDGVVDAGDYIVWRKFEGLSVALLNDPIGGTIDQDQYDQWRTHFGETAESGTGGSETVPEPTAVVFAGQLFVLWIPRSLFGCRAHR